MIASTVARYLIDLVVEQQSYMCLPGYEYTTEEFAQKFWDGTAYEFMVQDRIRMASYRQVIGRHVKDKVVLEIGTGALAPLARMCVQAGAKKVYAIEANERAARQAIAGLRRDGLEDRVEVITGFSYDVDVPEPAEVLVHEVVGNMGKDEGMARIVHDAKARLLRPEASFVPFGCGVQVAPVAHAIAPHRLAIKVFDLLYWTVKRDRRKLHIWNFPREDFLAEPQEYESIEFGTDFALEESRELRFPIARAGALSGLLFWNQIAVDRDVTIDCLRGTHWPTTYVPVCDPRVPVRPGDTLVLRTHQDMRVFPTYRFEPHLERGDQIIPLPTVSF